METAEQQPEEQEQQPKQQPPNPKKRLYSALELEDLGAPETAAAPTLHLSRLERYLTGG